MSERKGFSLVAAAAQVAKRLVKQSSGQAAYNTATATDIPIGVTQLNVGSGDVQSVKALNDGGSVEIEAAGAITREADVYAAADGRIQALPAGAGDYRKIGMAMEAASGAGSIIEVLPYDYNTVTTVT